MGAFRRVVRQGAYSQGNPSLSRRVAGTSPIHRFCDDVYTIIIYGISDLSTVFLNSFIVTANFNRLYSETADKIGLPLSVRCFFDEEVKKRS